MTTQEMCRATCRPGYWFHNIAPLGSEPDWREVVIPHTPDDSLLFGYNRAELMRKQYRKRV